MKYNLMDCTGKQEVAARGGGGGLGFSCPVVAQASWVSCGGRDRVRECQTHDLKREGQTGVNKVLTENR